jgi:hypothetical protein
MRYRLRTLLIAVAIAGLPLARIAYLKQMANSHRRKVAELVQKLATTADGVHERQVSVKRLASRDTVLKIGWIARSETHVNIFLDNGGGPGSGAIVENENAVDDWCSAVFHEVMANRYDRASYTRKLWMS